VAIHVSELRCVLPTCNKVQKICVLDGPRQNVPLLNISEFVNLYDSCAKYVHDVHNSYSCFEILYFSLRFA
jgi:hypothetical protein